MRADDWKAILAVLISLGLIFYAHIYVSTPEPPLELRMATGSQGGAYYEHSLHYQETLKKSNIILHVEAGEGSIASLAALKEGRADVALIQGGLAGKVQEGEIDVLGGVFYEAIWLFYNADLELQSLNDLRGRKVKIGAPGSGTRPLVLQLLALHNINADSIQEANPAGAELVEQLANGSLDAAFSVSAARLTPSFKELLSNSKIRLFNFQQAKAYQRHLPFLKPVLLPQGTLDLVNNLPEQDTQLLAASAVLATRPKLPKTVLRALLDTASQVHRHGDLLSLPEQFPSSHDLDYPLLDYADSYLRLMR